MQHEPASSMRLSPPLQESQLASPSGKPTENLAKQYSTFTQKIAQNNDVENPFNDLERFFVNLDELVLSEAPQETPSRDAKKMTVTTPAEPQSFGFVSDTTLNSLNSWAATPFLTSPSDQQRPLLLGAPVSFENFADLPRPSSIGRGNLVLFSCYPFILPDTLWSMEQDDVAYLEQRGCLRLPKMTIMDEFVKQYFLHVHPTMPLINERDFWAMYRSTTPSAPGSRKLSLFTFQSILFLACPFVPQSILYNLGFTSVRAARADFYNKAKVLFHVDGQRDDISSAQGALMLTYHSSSFEDRTNSYWLSTAVHFARNAGADKYETIHDDAETKNILKRLWWCCILRDRVMALGLRRPLHIRPTDFDFTQLGLIEDDIKDEITNSMVYDPATKQALAQLIASLCELAVLLNDVLSVCYPVMPNSTFELADTEDHIRSLKNYVSKLDSWYEAAVVKFQIQSPVFGVHESLPLFTSAIYIYYHTAKASLCHHILLLLLADPAAEAHGLYERWRASDEVEESLQNITDNLKELEHRGLIKYLPNTFVAFSALPLVWRISDMGFLSIGSRESQEKDSETYIRIFEGFRKLYEFTDSIIHTIGDPSLIRKAGSTRE